MASEEAIDWRIGLTTLERFTYMFDGMYSCEITFLVGEGEKQQAIPSHRFPLIAGSAVFEDLFKNNHSQEVTIPDVEPSAFKALIKCLYNGELDIQANNVLPLMHAANKYSVTEVIERCRNFLKSPIKADNVCTLLKTSLLYKEVTLAERCLKFIQTHAAEVLESHDFVDLSSEALKNIVKCDVLHLKSEVCVYKACIRWANSECARRKLEATDGNRRDVLGNVLFHIRFPTMTHEEFAEISSHSNLLTDAERVKIYDHIALHGKADCDFTFNTKLRGKRVTIRRFGPPNIKYGWETLTTHGAVNAVDIECNKSCSIDAVGLYGSDKPGYRNVTMKLFDDIGHPKVSTTKQVYTDGSKTPVRVDFPQPVMVSAGKRYTIVASDDGRDCTYYGDNGSQRVNAGWFSVTFHDSSHGMWKNKQSSTSGKAQEGQIPELYFNV